MKGLCTPTWEAGRACTLRDPFCLAHSQILQAVHPAVQGCWNQSPKMGSIEMWMMQAVSEPTTVFVPSATVWQVESESRAPDLHIITNGEEHDCCLTQHQQCYLSEVITRDTALQVTHALTLSGAHSKSASLALQGAMHRSDRYFVPGLHNDHHHSCNLFQAVMRWCACTDRPLVSLGTPIQPCSNPALLT